jgi:hypothetical protein
MPRWAMPMMMPPTKLMATMTIPAIASPLTNFEGLLLGDEPGVQVGVDRHLLARHRVEREPGPDFGDALGALRDDDELDDGEDEEDHGADHERPADRDLAERLDDLPGVRLAEDEARRGDVQAEPEERGHQEQAREDREVQGLLREHRGEQDQQRERDVHDDEHVEKRGRDRDDEQQDDPHDPDGNGRLRQQLSDHDSDLSPLLELCAAASVIGRGSSCSPQASCACRAPTRDV